MLKLHLLPMGILLCNFRRYRLLLQPVHFISKVALTMHLLLSTTVLCRFLPRPRMLAKQILIQFLLLLTLPMSLA